MKAVDNKMVKKLIKDLKKLNKHIDFEFTKYKGNYVFVDNINMSKVRLPQNWSYDGRLGLIYTDASKKSVEFTGEDNRYYIPTIPVELNQINDIEDLSRELQMLNPTSRVEVDYSTSEPKIISSTGLENLNYPDGFYYNEKNGLTNKHNSKTGLYLNVEVEHVDYVNDDYKLLCELQTLNPRANITIEPLSLFNYPEIHSSVPIDKLVLPDGFYYNEKNGITNKHNSLNGSYISVNVQHDEIKDAYDMAREILNLNKDIQVNLSNNGEQTVITIPEDMAGMQLPKGFVYQNGQITNKYNSQNNAVIINCQQSKSVVEQVKDKVEEAVAGVKGKVAQKKALKELNPMEFKDIKECFDKYTVGTKNGKLVAIDRKTNQVIEDEQIVSRVQFASAWVDACGNNLSLTGQEVFEGVDEKQYKYAFNEGAEQTFNSIIENIRYNLGGKVNLDNMAEAVHDETGYKYAESIVEGLLKNNANSPQIQMIKAELSKSAQALNMQQSLTNSHK